MLAALSGVNATAQDSLIVGRTPEGKLTYSADTSGDRVPDFSTCGYRGGGQPIPAAPVRVVVVATPGDNTARIQRAIDYVGGLEPDASGMRGAVLLLKGRHEILGGLTIANSGVVLRGQGMGADGTVLVAAGQDRRTVIRIAGSADLRIRSDSGSAIVDDRVPVGATRFRVRTAGDLKPGNLVRITRRSSAEWIRRLGATELGGGEGGGWKPGTRDLGWERTVTFVEGDLVTVDAPITTAIEKELGGGIVAPCSWPGRVERVGVEGLFLQSTFDASNPKDEDHAWCAIAIENAADAWVRQVRFEHFAGSAVAIYESCRRVTVQDCISSAPVSETGGYRRHTFFTMGQQTLFLRCHAEHGRHDFSVGHCAAGPNAFVQCEAREALDDSGPIESWASGVLYDGVRIDGNALTLGYRAGNNAGIGWAAANCVLWNCSASVIRCWNPPGARNWSFGSWASFEGDGIWRNSNEFMSPDSLYAAQVRDRFGPEAEAALRLMPRPSEASSNPSVEKAQELAATSHQPPPQLRDYIANAADRDSLCGEHGNAKSIEDIPVNGDRDIKKHRAVSSAGVGTGEIHGSESRSAIKRLTVTNGWLTCENKLLVGGRTSVAWWRGSIRPDEAAAFGLAVTRFVPGRVGPGFTDDLEQVADLLHSKGHVALDHNHGLWYDRRRDDHQRVRRINGDVVPPFYEQPFARGGQGTACDGLSKYNLAKFNPWYWARLRKFADICDERGLVLFHQNYFQHNVLEAGAHWTDFPWRSANNINNTGFPEPPPYAGDKRIFMAEPFYDITDAIRRELHRGYIRQCLNNFTNNANVIQFTGAEYTGPLHFMAFWIDNVAQWERTSGRDSMVALSCTRDVQDTILDDPKRRGIVDVIDFRYWWRTSKGLFAPPGGRNLAPRQFERNWRGGRPSDLDLAEMAADYRARFPDKALICDFDSAGWAWLCAGGSLPRLPVTTDTRLLAAIPGMAPDNNAANSRGRLLREKGKQWLAYLDDSGELDLSSESGSFRVNLVNVQSGRCAPREIVKAGGKVALPAARVVWLTKE